MALSDRLKEDLIKEKTTKESNIEFFKEQILVTDALKEDYDNAIKYIDLDMISDIEVVNNTIEEVESLYQDRIDAGCRSDLFWRVQGFDIGTGNYSLIVTKLSPVGYGTSVLFVDTLGGITTYVEGDLELPGIESDNLHGLKYYYEPHLKDIGDTTLTTFVGSIGFGSTILSIVSRFSEEISDAYFEVGDLVVCSKPGVFANENTNKIVGFGTTTITGISTFIAEELVGIATTSFSVSTLILETPSIGFSSIPESDGSFTDYIGVISPQDFEAIKPRFRYYIKFTKNPFSPQDIGILNVENAGIGTYIEYDNSGNPPNTQSWQPEFDGIKYKSDTKIKEPKVGAGKVYYKVGYTSQPTIFGIPQAEGSTHSASILTGLYSPITPPSGCTAIDNQITAAIGVRDSAELNFSNTIVDRVNAANAIRKERSEFSLKIWGLRQSIGGENDRVTELEYAVEYIDQNISIIDQ